MWQVKYQRKWYLNGTLLTETNPVTYNITPWSSGSKSSVDTGFFEPGVFRINPYYVSSARDSVFHEGGKVIVRWPDGSNIVEDHYEGPVLALLARAKIGSVVGARNRNLIRDSKDYGPHVLQKAMGKVGQSALQLGVEAGELRETLEMLRNPFKKLRTFFLSDRKKNLDLFNRTLKVLSNKYQRRHARKLGLKTLLTSADTWLEFRYGLRPLISSVQDVIEEVGKKRWVFDAEKIRTAKALRVGEHLTYEESYRSTHNYLSYYFLLQTETRTQFTASVCYKREYEQSANSRWMLSPEFFPEIVWELTRLSFVADWFFTIGPWLSSYRIKPGIRILGNTVGRKYVTDGVARPHKFFYEGSYYTCQGIKSASPPRRTNSSYERTCNEDLSSTPLLDIDVDLCRTIDGLSLILQPVIRKIWRPATKFRSF